MEGPRGRAGAGTRVAVGNVAVKIVCELTALLLDAHLAAPSSNISIVIAISSNNNQYAWCLCMWRVY